MRRNAALREKFEKAIRELLNLGKGELPPELDSTDQYVKAFFEGRLKIYWSPKGGYLLYELSWRKPD